MKLLSDLLRHVTYIELYQFEDRIVTSLVNDSRKVTEQSVFIAIKGTQVDGHDFIDSVYHAGCRIIILEKLPEKLHQNLCYILVTRSTYAQSALAAAFYDFPALDLKIVGITGTNGKTTTATLLYQLFRNLGYSVGLLSTIVNKINELDIPSTHTTPDSIILHSLLAQMKAEGVTYVFMEVSSHALVQDRVAHLPFCVGIFTNITQDHLDYHGSFASYIQAKKLLFDHLNSDALALINADDSHHKVMVQNTKAQIKRFALKSSADYTAQILEADAYATTIRINHEKLITMQLLGEFNVYNALSVYAVGEYFGISMPKLLSEISNLRAIEGRFDKIYNINKTQLVIVDYAHTPDALAQILKEALRIKDPNGNLYLVFGCGGNRDKGKRPLMGQIAVEYSYRVIITSDNPRDEDPLAIIQEIKQGITDNLKAKVLTVIDRREAISTGVALLEDHDILVIAGKGHEKYQEINGIKSIFDDKATAMEFLKAKTPNL
ncbi:MAG: UDP-N-acetylmuramoyl-L-alanyl-D-glutamate--2,6-diaminopimelate ligase [Chitinophagales bacterium]|jgi:UDP-N-acetylmuramoyl-L-alanyl-D-glutamate--2,6-diaminopimelate ligase|nr:UDP-N-acetylmuramoyl-L-alanyl-D-glutamate--2,6-diaminopimelate ligase [Chitinophagales bacterium]